MTIQNCWLKTNILPSMNNMDDVNDLNDLNNLDNLDFMNTDNTHEEINYIFNNLPEAVRIQEYLEQFDISIPTEENLSDEQIINLVQLEENEDKDENSSDEEIPLITAKQAINGLEIFIKYFEQQNDNLRFNISELHIFQKYLYITKVVEINSKKQSTIDNFIGN